MIVKELSEWYKSTISIEIKVEEDTFILLAEGKPVVRRDLGIVELSHYPSSM